MNTPERIAQSIPHETDPDRLRTIAAELERWGWWDKAAEAKRRAEQIERRYAEQVAR